MQAPACLRRHVWRGQDRGSGPWVGDRAHHLARPAPQNQLDPVVDRAVQPAGAVPDRVGHELGHDHRCVLNQTKQAPAEQDLAGEVARGSTGAGPEIQGAEGNLTAPAAGSGRYGSEPELLCEAGRRPFTTGRSAHAPDGNAGMSLGHYADLGGGAI